MEREPDLLWDALVKIFGDVSNDGSRGRRQKAHMFLKQSGATPEEVHRRAELYPDRIGGTFTDTALANNWDRLGEEVPQTGMVESTFKALWPRANFEKEGWRRILGNFPKEDIATTLEKIAFSSPFPPGAAEVKKRLIEDTGQAPASLDEAKNIHAQRVQEGNAGLDLETAEKLPDLMVQAWHNDAKVFATRYTRLLEEFFLNYGS